MKRYILINAIVKVSDMKIPDIKNYMSDLGDGYKTNNIDGIDFKEDYNELLNSLKPCEIDDYELNKIHNYIFGSSQVCDYKGTYEITDIVEEKDGKIYFKDNRNIEKLYNDMVDLIKGNDNGLKKWINCENENPKENGYYFCLYNGNPKDILGSRPSVHFWDNQTKEWSSKTTFWLKSIIEQPKQFESDKSEEQIMFSKEEMINCMKEYYKQGFIDYRQGLEADPDNIACIYNAINIGLNKTKNKDK